MWQNPLRFKQTPETMHNQVRLKTTHSLFKSSDALLKVTGELLTSYVRSMTWKRPNMALGDAQSDAGHINKG